MIELTNTELQDVNGGNPLALWGIYLGAMAIGAAIAAY